jgi:predicted RNA-binding protein YlqC (UPF0109 family)
MTGQPSAVAEQVHKVTREILERMGITAVISLRQEEDSVRITLHSQESGLLIGKQGATLNSLQFLVGLIVNRGRGDGKIKVVLDTEGYRNRRQATLEATAHRVAEKALATGKIMEIHTMSSYERRIIHLTLAPVPGVSTRSEGVGPQRQLLVIPEGAKDGSVTRYDEREDDGYPSRGPGRLVADVNEGLEGDLPELSDDELDLPDLATEDGEPSDREQESGEPEPL